MSTENEVEIKRDKVTETYRFDSRRKALTRTIKSHAEVRFTAGTEPAGQMETTQVQTYDEDGIKLLIQQLKLAQDTHAKQFASVNQTLEATAHIKENDELSKLRELLQQLQGYDQRKKAEEQRDYLLKDAEATKDQLRAVMKAIGEHVKVD